MSEEEIKTQGQAREFLALTFETIYDKALQRVAESDRGLLLEAKARSEELIQQISIRGPVKKDTLWARFIEEFYNGGILLISTLVDRLIEEQWNYSKWPKAQKKL